MLNIFTFGNVYKLFLNTKCCAYGYKEYNVCINSEMKEHGYFNGK